VVLGGVYATLCTTHAQTYSGADYVLGEYHPGKILHAIDEIVGISSKKDYRSVEFFDACPAFDVYPQLDYACLLTSIGCPYRCTYCASQILVPHFVQRPPEDVFQEFLHEYETLGIRHFAFYDDALLVRSAQHLEPFMQQVIDAKLSCTFHTPNGLHARYITERMADLMFRSGFTTIRLSLETIDPIRQRTTGGKVTGNELVQAIKFLKQAGFGGQQIGIYVFIGLPGQSFKETEETLYYVHNLGVQAHLCEYSPIPGTADWPLLEQKGYVNSGDDPILHNNSIFIFHKQRYQFGPVQELKDLVRALNGRITSAAKTHEKK
jgi:radical SAM superfamily enzyme YgiQ (UPF0313 family)